MNDLWTWTRRLADAERALDDFAESLPVEPVRRARLILDTIRMSRDTSAAAEGALCRIETWLASARAYLAGSPEYPPINDTD